MEKLHRTAILPRLAAALFVLSVAGGAPGCAYAESADMLLGKWSLTGEKPGVNTPGVHCAKSALLFGQNAEAWLSNGQQANGRVLGYDMSGNDVHVTTMGGVDAYTVLDHNHIQFNELYVACIYTRVG